MSPHVVSTIHQTVKNRESRKAIGYSRLTLYRHIKTAEQRPLYSNGDCYTGEEVHWYSEEGPGRAAAPPRPLLAYQM